MEDADYLAFHHTEEGFSLEGANLFHDGEGEISEVYSSGRDIATDSVVPAHEGVLRGTNVLGLIPRTPHEIDQDTRVEGFLRRNDLKERFYGF